MFVFIFTTILFAGSIESLAADFDLLSCDPKTVRFSVV